MYFSIYDGNTSATLEVSIPGLPPILEAHLREVVHNALHRNPGERPRAEHFLSLCDGYLYLLDPSVMVDVQAPGSLPSYSKHLATKRTNAKNSYLLSLGNWWQLNKNYDDAVSICKELINRNPDDMQPKAQKVNHLFRS